MIRPEKTTLLLGFSVYLIATMCLLWDLLLVSSKYYIHVQLLFFILWMLAVLCFILNATKYNQKYWWFIFSIPLLKGPLEFAAIYIAFSIFGYNAP